MTYLLTLSVLLFVVTSGWAIHRVGRMKDKTISQHIAKNKRVQIVFGVSGAIATILASIAVFGRILPSHHAHIFTDGLFGILMAFFLIAVVIPQIENTWRAKVHYAAAWGMCFIIPVVILLTLFWKLILVVWVVGLIAFIAIIVLLALFIFWKNLRKNFLVFQSLYLSIFFVYLLVLSIG